MAGANYPELYDHLRGLIGRLGKELPGPMSGFSQLHKQALADGVLDAKTKELMALAISISRPLRWLHRLPHERALRAGATRPEVLETIGVAVLMGGGPAAVYGAQALEALEQFQPPAGG